MKNQLKITVLLLIVYLTSAAPVINCSSKADLKVNDCDGTPQKSYYIGMHFKLNFYRAAEFCNYHNMRLATINSKKENEQVFDEMKLMGFAKQNVWISATDLGEEGKFVWLSTGVPVTYSNFMKNQPDNYQNMEHCVEINEKGEWNDKPCNSQLYFICEYYF